MANRVLLGQGSATRGSTNYGLWVSKSGTDVLTTGNANIIFSSVPLGDTSGMVNYQGRTLIKAAQLTSNRTANVHPPTATDASYTPPMRDQLTFVCIKGPTGAKSHPYVFWCCHPYNQSYRQQGGSYGATRVASWEYGAQFTVEKDGYNSAGSPYVSGTEYGAIKINEIANGSTFHATIFYDGVE